MYFNFTIAVYHVHDTSFSTTSSYCSTVKWHVPHSVRFSEDPPEEVFVGPFLEAYSPVFGTVEGLNSAESHLCSVRMVADGRSSARYLKHCRRKSRPASEKFSGSVGGSFEVAIFIMTAMQFDTLLALVFDSQNTPCFLQSSWLWQQQQHPHTIKLHQ